MLGNLANVTLWCHNGGLSHFDHEYWVCDQSKLGVNASRFSLSVNRLSIHPLTAFVAQSNVDMYTEILVCLLHTVMPDKYSSYH